MKRVEEILEGFSTLWNVLRRWQSFNAYAILQLLAADTSQLLPKGLIS
jgi:hypothetical protein